MYAQPRPCRGGGATSRERGGIGIAAGGKGEPPPPPPYTISDDDRGSPQTPGAGSAVGLGRRSVGLEPHESPTTPPHRRDGRTRCRPMQAAASTAPAILAAARRHAPARKRGYRRRSRAACVVIRAAPGPLFDVTAALGAGRCAPDPRPLSHPPPIPLRGAPSTARRLERLLPNRNFRAQCVRPTRHASAGDFAAEQYRVLAGGIAPKTPRIPPQQRLQEADGQ